MSPAVRRDPSLAAQRRAAARGRLCLIPARGGSKRFPRKNLARFAGKPLVVHAVEVARRAALFDRIVVSTDDPEIAAVAARAGAEIHRRETALAGDTARIADVCRAVLDALEGDGERYACFCVLIPTAPFRAPRHVRESLGLLDARRANVVMSVAEFPHVPWWGVREVRGFLRLEFGPRVLTARQRLPRLLRHNGVVLWARTAAFRRHPEFYGARVVPYHMDQLSSVDVDDALDLEFADFLRRKGYR